MIKLTINGQSVDIDGPIHLVEFLNSISVDIKFVAVAYNGEVIDKEKFPPYVYQLATAHRSSQRR